MLTPQKPLVFSSDFPSCFTRLLRVCDFQSLASADVTSHPVCPCVGVGWREGGECDLLGHFGCCGDWKSGVVGLFVLFRSLHLIFSVAGFGYTSSSNYLKLSFFLIFSSLLVSFIFFSSSFFYLTYIECLVKWA